MNDTEMRKEYTQPEITAELELETRAGSPLFNPLEVPPGFFDN